MNNRIVVESTALIKEKARNTLRGNWLYATVAFMVFYLLTVTVRELLNFVVDNSMEFSLPTVGLIKIVISGNLYDALTTPIFTFGLSGLILVLISSNKVKLDIIFEGFSLYLKILWMSILMAIKIILWSMLFIIPGFIAALNYSQSYFILFEDPSKSASQCIAESVSLMKGNKMNYFYLIVSYIGWIFLAAIAGTVLSLPIAFEQSTSYFTIMYSLVTMIPSAIVCSYLYTGAGHFYQLLKPIEGTYSEVFYN